MTVVSGTEPRQSAVRIVLADAVLDRLPPSSCRQRQAGRGRSWPGKQFRTGRAARAVRGSDLGAQNGRLVFDIRDASDTPLRLIGIALGPFRRLIKDYMLLVESHEGASRREGAQRIEAIDMGRRGLHNEGAAQMVERLRGKVAIDFETARRLFTLACALQQR